MTNGNPVWKRPGHFDRFEFTNLSADPQTLTGVNIDFKDGQGAVIWTATLTTPPVVLAIGAQWAVSPQPTQAYADVVEFIGQVDLQSGKRADFHYVLQNQPPYSYIWQARLGLQTDSLNQLVAFGNVDFMTPLQASLQPGEWSVH